MVIEDINIPQDTFEIMLPVILVTRIFGLLPIKYIKYGTQYKVNWSIGYGIYSYLLAIILTIATLLGVINDLQEDEQHSIRMKDKKSRYVTCSDISIVIVIIVFNTVSLPFKLKKFWELLHRLNQADTIIPITRQRKFRNASIYFISAVFLVTLALLSYDMSVWATSTKRSQMTATFFRNYLSFYFLYWILVTQEVFFWHIIFFIKIRISFLNKSLIDIEKENMDKFYRKIFVQTYGTKASMGQIAVTPVERPGSMKENYSGTNSSMKSAEKFNIADRVIALTKFQEKIYEAVETVNDCMAYGIHLIMLSCLLHLIVTPYFLLNEIMNNGNLFFISLQSAWLFGHLGRVLTIVEPCQLCLNENKKTSNLICELLSCNFEDDVKKALSIFAMQLSNCKIKFSCCGFFKINRSLLTSIAGAVTTYLVILFQFNN